MRAVLLISTLLCPTASMASETLELPIQGQCASISYFVLDQSRSTADGAVRAIIRDLWRGDISVWDIRCTTGEMWLIGTADSTEAADRLASEADTSQRHKGHEGAVGCARDGWQPATAKVICAHHAQRKDTGN